MQVTDCRLDHVLLTFGRLFRFFSREIEADEDGSESIGQAVLDSLEMRWSKADQDAFVAAVLLNPYVKTGPFKPINALFSPVGIGALLERLWIRFYPSEPVPPSLYEEQKEYFENAGDMYTNLPLAMERQNNTAKTQVRYEPVLLVVASSARA